MTEFIIYKIYCKEESIIDCYVGSTDNFDRRCGHHISNCNNENSKEYNLKVYKFIREHNGMDNFIIEPIIECDEENRYDCEVHYFLKLNAKLNTRWPRRNPKQYYNDNKEKKKQYRIDNKEKIKQYYNDNKEHLSEQFRQHYIDNREHLLERKRTKIECECGVSYSCGNKARHYRSQKHLNYISTK